MTKPVARCTNIWKYSVISTVLLVVILQANTLFIKLWACMSDEKWFIESIFITWLFKPSFKTTSKRCQVLTLNIPYTYMYMCSWQITIIVTKRHKPILCVLSVSLCLIFIESVWWINMRDVSAFNKNGWGPKYDKFPFLKCSDIKYSSAFRGL